MCRIMDISTGTHTRMDIFRLILDEGPLTLYTASTKSHFPLGTIHRHFKEMEKSKKIKVYDIDQKSRRKKPYGPTVFGIVSVYDFDKKIRSKLENYFLLWIEHKEFLSDLKENGFDADKIISNPKKSKELFRKYVEYGAAVERQLALLQKDPSLLPREVSVFVGEILLVTMNPSYMKQWEELYINLPGLRKAIDSYLGSMIQVQNRLKKKSH